MSFQLSCTHCGATLKTASKIAPGKKVKCPKCTKLFVVEPDEEETDKEPEVPDDRSDDQDDTPKGKEPGKFSDDEEDDDLPKGKKPAKFSDDDKEDDDDTPKGKKSVKSSDDDDEDQDDAPKGKKPAKDNDDEDDDDDTPSRKKGDSDKPKKKTGLIIGIVLGVLLLCCCLPTGGAGWFFWSAISQFLGFVDAVQKDLKKLDGALKDRAVDKAIDMKPPMNQDKKPEPAASLSMSADELAKHIDSGFNRFRATHDGKTADIKGVVDQVTKNPDSSVTVQLKTPTNTRLFVTFQPPDTVTANPGQPISFRVTFENYLRQDRDFRIGGRPIPR